MDVYDKAKRSQVMARVRSKDTAPEMVVRRLLHRMGFRFRLHCPSLPGKPDIVLPRHRKVIFVHGCFWHGHQGCKHSKAPASNVGFWSRKLSKNRERDMQTKQALESMGWQVLIVWECQTKDEHSLEESLRAFLDPVDADVQAPVPVACRSAAANVEAGEGARGDCRKGL